MKIKDLRRLLSNYPANLEIEFWGSNSETAGVDILWSGANEEFVAFFLGKKKLNALAQRCVDAFYFAQKIGICDQKHMDTCPFNKQLAEAVETYCNDMCDGSAYELLDTVVAYCEECEFKLLTNFFAPIVEDYLDICNEA